MSSEVGVGCARLMYRIDSVPQAIILRVVFGSGITGVRYLERCVYNNVVRSSSKLAELGKELGSAYQEVPPPVFTRLRLLLDEQRNEGGIIQQRRALWQRG